MPRKVWTRSQGCHSLDDALSENFPFFPQRAVQSRLKIWSVPDYICVLIGRHEEKALLSRDRLSAQVKSDLPPMHLRTQLPRRIPSNVNWATATLHNRHYATSHQNTVAKQESERASPRRKRPLLSLQHFLLRSRALALYRTVLRVTARGDSSFRDEMRLYARGEFERRREEVDLRTIRYLISTGKAEVDRLRAQVHVGRGGGK